MSELLKDIETFLTNMHKVPPEFVPPKAEALRKRVQAARAQGGEAVAYLVECDGLKWAHAEFKDAEVQAMRLGADVTELYTHRIASVPDGWKLTRETDDRITMDADGIGFYVARMNSSRISEIMLYALANDLLLDQDKP